MELLSSTGVACTALCYCLSMSERRKGIEVKGGGGGGGKMRREDLMQC